MVSAVVLTATGVNADGHREVLGLRVATTESSAAWNGLLADLVARGLTGVRLVTSDAHTGLVEAIAANLPGATWQRCRTHYAANLMTVVPKSLWPAVKAMLHWRLRPARRSSRRGSVRPPPGLRPHDPARGCRPPRSRTSRPAGLPPPSLSRYGDRSGPTTPKNASTESPWVLWRLVYLVPVVAGCDCSWRWRSGAQAASCSAGGAHADGGVWSDGARTSGPTRRWRARAASMSSQGPWLRISSALYSELSASARAKPKGGLPWSPPR